MKRIIALLSVLALMIPLFGVNAEEKKWYTYTPGEEVNFYGFEGDTTGVTTYILNDEGENSQFVKTWASGIVYASSSPYYDEVLNGEYKDDFKTSENYSGLINKLSTEYKALNHAKDITADGNLQLITLDELKTVFGATYNEATDTYTLDTTKWEKVFNETATELNLLNKKGLFTQTYDKDSNKIWAIEYTIENNKLTAVTVKKVELTSNEYGYSPVVYMDKTYDCKEREQKIEYACYKCDDDYSWVEVGKQANTCTLTEKSKSDCVKPVKTGVEDYAVEFIAVVVICGLALYVVKKKNVFNQI